jgi:spectinomycin phosphotransferase
VRDRPAGLREHDLRLVLAEGWRIDAAALRYAAVGGGSYHWVVRDGAGRRWFVTADDLDDKAWLGHTRPAVMAGLRSAMETALALRRDAGLDFVVAPVPGVDGAAVRPAGAGHAVAVFPFLSGTPGRFGEALPAAERAARTDMLAALHRSALHEPALHEPALHRPALAGAPVAAIGLARREDLDAALRDLGRPWRAGPFGEQARTLLAGAGDQIHGLLEVFDRRAGAIRADDFVITHGEPHPGNVMRVGPRRMLIDWDTVGLGPPERDLWMVAGEEEARRYAGLTGRAVDPGLLEWYRLRWALDDISAFAHRLRSAHGRTADAEHAWVALKQTVASLGGHAAVRPTNC